MFGGVRSALLRLTPSTKEAPCDQRNTPPAPPCPDRGTARCGTSSRRPQRGSCWAAWAESRHRGRAPGVVRPDATAGRDLRRTPRATAARDRVDRSGLPGRADPAPAPGVLTVFEPLGSDDFDEHRVLEFDRCSGRPGAVLVETSFIQCVLHRAEPNHARAAAFWDHLNLADTSIVYSGFTEFELFEAAQRKGPRRGVTTDRRGRTCCVRPDCTGPVSMRSPMTFPISWRSSA